MKWFHKKTIVVPFDFSDESVSAIEVAIKLAESAKDIHVLHVIQPIAVTDPGVIWDTVNDSDRKRHAHDAMLKRLDPSKFPVDSMHLEVGIGDPGHVVVDRANEIDAGLVVLPSHGRTGIKRAILGSVAERVVRHAHCPVLVLKK